MRYGTSVVYLEQVPKIEIDSGFDWITVGGFALTILAFVLGTIVTINNFRRTIESQEKIADASSLRSSRQAWINELRDCCASYVAAVLRIHDFKGEMVRWQQDNNLLMSELLVLKRFESENPAWKERSVIAVNEARMLRAKVEMFLNPAEPESIELLKAMDLAYDEAGEYGPGIPGKCDVVVEKAAVILRNEWAKTKVGS
ncbi:hypothetical protein DZA01_02165 [Pseudomonas aeruginosa]|uniref:hypothetical protein n=1 Tax=Pseudomonas aeruginosa TaxID=287 RepID=UPI000F835F43|nr:hypothetical protein [Pseudomonas aeruginosa]RTW26573.1 hypothetical protein DZA01_02165 [Pseudomonas aeruginosa]